MLLYDSELTNAYNQLSLRLHAQCRSLYLASLDADRRPEGADRPLLCRHRLLLYPDRSQNPVDDAQPIRPSTPGARPQPGTSTQGLRR